MHAREEGQPTESRGKAKEGRNKERRGRVPRQQGKTRTRARDARGVRCPLAVGAGLRAWGPSTVPLACTPCVPRGWSEAVPGGWPSGVVRGVWCLALSLFRPPVSSGGQPGLRNPCFPGAGGVGVETQHWPHSVRSCEPAWHAVAPAGKRPRGGCPAPL